MGKIWRVVVLASVAFTSFTLLIFWFVAPSRDGTAHWIEKTLLGGNRLPDSVPRIINSLDDNHETLLKATSSPLMPANHTATNVHIFYYPWYANMQFNGRYAHWNHPILPHWKQKNPDSKIHYPPDDIGSNFYPKRGCYSSTDPSLVRQHFSDIRDAGIGVVVSSWYPPNMTDPNGVRGMADAVVPLLLDTAAFFDLKISLHIEPYQGRSADSIHRDLKYIFSRYANHSAFFTLRDRKRDRELPVFYIYDSYLSSDYSWRRLLSSHGDLSIRNTQLDSIFIGLLVEKKHLDELYFSKFDGFYTYFAANRFSYGSDWNFWSLISDYARTHEMYFMPSIGPGYIDTRIRPWNSKTTRHRDGGRYYMRSFEAARKSGARFLTITSYNEWGEGTQIEQAIPKTTVDFKYENYLPKPPDFYLKLTGAISDSFMKLLL